MRPEEADKADVESIVLYDRTHGERELAEFTSDHRSVAPMKDFLIVEPPQLHTKTVRIGGSELAQCCTDLVKFHESKHNVTTPVDQAAQTHWQHIHRMLGGNHPDVQRASKRVRREKTPSQKERECLCEKNPNAKSHFRIHVIMGLHVRLAC